ncbi:hypothetical protein BDV93DRAFT_522471, partial [Ceratobasidium sp. AG-I]
LPSYPADLSRFDLYARFVQTLSIFDPIPEQADSDKFYIDSSWQTALLHAQKSTLLPNLRELRLNKIFVANDDPALWLTVFLSPSIKAFGMEKVQPYANPASSMAAVALNLATQRCPGLENITFYLGPPEQANSQNNEGSVEASPLHILMGAPISLTWLSAQNLRSLVTDVYALDADSLLALGQLPHLISLEIRKPSTHTRSFPDRLSTSIGTMTLSNNSFPSLRRLAIFRMHGDDILLLWDHKSLVERLNRVELTVLLIPRTFTEHGRIESEQFLTPFLPVLCAGSPQLAELVIENYLSTPATGISRFDMNMLKCLSLLPLQRVKLAGIRIAYTDPDEEFAPFAKHAVTLWPKAVDLDLPDQRVNADELHYFAMIPNLGRLVLCLWDDCFFEDESPPMPNDHPLHTLEIKGGLKGMLKDIPMDKFARYLLSFWPNLQQVRNPTEPSSISLMTLNQFIRTFQGIAEAKRRIIGKYGAQEAHNLLPAELVDFPLR